jgi:hypothetical protein
LPKGQAKESFAEHIPTGLDVCIYNPLSMKNFHGVSAGNIHKYMPKTYIGKVRFIAVIWFGSSSLQTANAQDPDCTHGPDTCKQGFVWREADERDHICVRPEVGEHTRGENRLASLRLAGSGPSGPNTCNQGFV